MTIKFKMPEPQPFDADVGVRIIRENHIGITLCGSGVELSLSDYNAARLFRSLAQILGIPLPAALKKDIKLTRGGK